MWFACGASSDGDGTTSTGGAVAAGGSEVQTGGSATGGSSDGGAATGGSGSTGDTGSPDCGSSTPLESGTLTIDVGGTSRTYVLDVPTDYETGQAYPLVFVWHPLGGSADQVVRGGYDGLKALADGTAIFVAPDGLNGTAAGINGKGWYNDGGGDMEFLQAMLDHFSGNLCIDQDRIFSTGFSYGGMMSYAVGFEFGDVFRALAPASGNLQGTPHQQTTTNAIAVMAFHGDGDTFVPTDGGRQALEAYRTRNGCQDQTQAVDPSPCVEYQGCEVPTIWCEFPGEHNPWSSAPQAIWNFFSQF